MLVVFVDKSNSHSIFGTPRGEGGLRRGTNIEAKSPFQRHGRYNVVISETEPR